MQVPLSALDAILTLDCNEFANPELPFTLIVTGISDQDPIKFYGNSAEDTIKQLVERCLTAERKLSVAKGRIQELILLARRPA